MTLDTLVPLLRCPASGKPLDFEEVPQAHHQAGTCGLLRSSYGLVYPVLDGVPILTDARLDIKSIADSLVLAPGPEPGDIAALVAAGRGLDALVELLAFPVCPWPLNRAGPTRRASLWTGVRTLSVAARGRSVRAMLRRRDALTAEDWLASFYWHSPTVNDPFNYFLLRPGQPRHLATLGLLTVLPPAAAPVLDLACGYGHFLHALTVGQGLPAIGLDQNFHQVWVARHYIAPGAAVVCADADRPLPFADGSLSAAMVADAFGHLYKKAQVLAEFDRVTGGGPALIASVGNRLVAPLEADERTPDGYAALLGERPWRVLTEPDLLARYLDGRAPDLSESSPAAEVDATKFLYYVVDPSQASFTAHGPFATWPHAAGTLGVHPIYARDGDRLRFAFPSPWYAFENRAMQDYMPDTATLPPGIDDALVRGEVPPAAEPLLAVAVLLGMPDRYANRRRPLTQRANRTLAHALHRLRSAFRPTAEGASI